MNIEKKEILRYMKLLPEQNTPELDACIERDTKELLSIIRPRHIYREFDCRTEGSHVTVGAMQADSVSLSRHLAPCTRAVLMAATLGHETDQLLHRLSLTDMSRAVIDQAIAVTIIEAYCDDIEEEIIAQAGQRGYKTKWRFSPGYGDFSLIHQRDFFAMLDCPKNTGMTLTDTLMMNPIKSVTAIIGLYKEGNSKA